MTTAEASVVDPVCGMTVDPATPEMIDFDGQTYYFCESTCAEIFREDPRRWIEARIEHDHD